MKRKKLRALRVQLYHLDDADNKRTLHCVLPDDDANWQEYIHHPADVPVFDENGQVDGWLHELITSITYSEYTLEDERVNRTLGEYEQVFGGKLEPWTPSIHNIQRMQILKRILLSFILRAARDRKHTYRMAFSFVGDSKDIPEPQDLNEALNLEGSG
jgi:hypothetical protein